MPRSASAVGLAKRGVIPRKQFYLKMFFFNTVMLATFPLKIQKAGAGPETRFAAEVLSRVLTFDGMDGADSETVG